MTRPQPETWRILRRRVPLAGEVLQFAVYKHGQWIPLGPWADDLETLRADAAKMLAACDEPILDESEVETA